MQSELVNSNKNTDFHHFDISEFGTLRHLQNSIAEQAPFLKKVFQSRIQEFGNSWAENFETELATFFGATPDRIALAARGYADFAMDAIKLQKKFNKTREYIVKKYSDLMDSVYLNHEYMFNLYLPGILLSQYLWPHHYRQLEFFKNKFVPLALQENISLFYDVGVGTGFYSKEMLRSVPSVRGIGLDISPHSLNHAQKLVAAWDLSSRYQTKIQNILDESWSNQADAVINVEVLEHLEDPRLFLNSLYDSLRPGGIAFITAAVNAPNFDHIYLYRSLHDVAEQISSVGFTIVEALEFFAYEALAGEIAPSSAVFILRKEKIS